MAWMSPVSSSIRKMVPAPSPEMVYLVNVTSSESEWIWGGREEGRMEARVGAPVGAYSPTRVH